MATYAFSSAALFHIAKQAAERSREDPSQSVVAIVFAAIGAECFVNEVLDALKFPLSLLDPTLDRTRRMAEATELFDRNATLSIKIQVLYASLAEKSLDRGAQPFQDFRLLTTLRNYVVHKRTDRIPDDESPDIDIPKLFVELRTRVLGTSAPTEVAEHSFSLLTKVAVADWAVDAARAMVVFLLEHLPHGERLRFHVMYGSLGWFTVPPSA